MFGRLRAVPLSLRAAIVLLILTLSACGGGPESPPAPSRSSSTVPESPTGTPPSSSPPGPAAVSPHGTPTTVVSDLDVPWSVAFVGRTALLTERDSARILELDGQSTRVIGTVPEVKPQAGEGGLLGLAVRGRDVYVYYTASSDNRVVRFPLTGSPGQLGLGASQPILAGIPSNTFHNGGRIKFGPDGMLYVSTGDGGHSADAQSLNSLSGKILRVTPTGAIPPDNPVPNSPIWSWGHRNVQGLGWAADGTMFASEFGQDRYDELNLIRKGANYGWPEVEGIAHDPRFTDPQQEWPVSEASPSGLAIVGGTIFIANLRGERLRSIPLADPSKAKEFYVGRYGRLRDVQLAPDGSLWLLTNNTDGRGRPNDHDDRILRVALATT
jgi:glucose/arabinose dehydrogenase